MLAYLSLHTKVRRLGYLKLILEQYFDKDFLSANTFNQYFEKLASKEIVKKQLDDYLFIFQRDSKGVIENIGSGNSARPYVKLAENLSIIAKHNYSYILTKHSKVYKILYNNYRVNSHSFKYINEQIPLYQLDLFRNDDQLYNIFYCNTLDRYYFLKQLFEKDFLFIKTIFRVIKENPGKNISKNGIKYFYIKKSLFKSLASELKFQLKSNIFKPLEKQQALALLDKFESNKLSIRSYESIVEPRISWLIDLNLIDIKSYTNDFLILSDHGEILLNEIKGVSDVTFFLENNFLKTFNLVYNITSKVEKPSDKKLDKYIDESFMYFKTLAPNRITISQAINYAVMSCFLKDGLIIEYEEVKKYIFNSEGLKYIIDWFPSENDGSMKKRE